MECRSRLILSGIILTGALELTTLPQRPIEVLVLAVVLFVAVLLVESQQILVFPKDITVALGVLLSIYIGHLFVDAVAGTVQTYSLLRVPIFTVVLIIFLFLVPQSTSTDGFLSVLSRFGGITTLVGVIALAAGGFSIGPLHLIPWHSTIGVIPFFGGPRVNAMTAYFTNPNMVSFVCAVGLVAAFGEFDRKRSMITILLLILNGIGLLLSQSRALLLGAGVGISMYVAYRLFSRELALIVFTSAIGGILTLIGVQFELLPPIEPFASVSLNYREVIWSSAMQAIVENPVFGRGIVPAGPIIEPFITSSDAAVGTHSAYINQLLMGGIIGLIAYVYIYVSVLVGGVMHVKSRRAMTVYSVTVVLMISQMFDTYSIFGVTMLPAVTALSLGYSIRESVESRSEKEVPDTGAYSRLEQTVDQPAD